MGSSIEQSIDARGGQEVGVRVDVWIFWCSWWWQCGSDMPLVAVTCAMIVGTLRSKLHRQS